MKLVYANLEGREFVYGTHDCYTIVRDFYKQNFDIDLPNYARPNRFWEFDMDMYMDRYITNGFQVLDCHPSEYRPGDVVLMAINSAVANHAGVFVENGKMIHHLWGRLSVTEGYRDLFRNTTVAIMRHKDVVVEIAETTSDITEYLSPRVRKQLLELRAEAT